MIIEGAFLKLPEILLGSSDQQGIYEANVANLFAMGVLLELNARNIDNPLKRIQLERKYMPDQNFRADVYLDFNGLFEKDSGLDLYGVKPSNWIEAKFFGGIGRGRGNETKVENAGSLMFDIFRLCAFTPVSVADPTDIGRYVLNIFNREPNQYLAYTRQRRDRREWLHKLLCPGLNEFSFDMSAEPKTVKQLFGEEFVNTDMNLKMVVTTVTTEFRPFVPRGTQYWGYLSRIVAYKMWLGSVHIEYSDGDVLPETNVKIDSYRKMASLAACYVK